MSKAERRKRSRERQRQREAERQQALAGDRATTEAQVVTAAEGAASDLPPPVSPPTVAPAPAESPYITGPLVAAASSRARTAPLPSEERELIQEAIANEDDEDGEDEDDLLGEEDDGDDGDDLDDDDDDDDLELEDCLFEAACGAVEQGPKLAWSELCAWLAAAEITDPRLALLIGLLCEDDTKLTGERVLGTLEEMELGELVAEARELVAEEAEGESDPEERAVVRTTSRELKEQAEQHLGGRRDERKPVKSTQLRRGGTASAVLAMAALGTEPAGGGGRKS